MTSKFFLVRTFPVKHQAFFKIHPKNENVYSTFCTNDDGNLHAVSSCRGCLRTWNIRVNCNLEKS